MSDETNQQEPTFEESVAEVLRDLPPPIYTFITGPERDAVFGGLIKKYGLHVDQAGQFERALLFMIMGIYTPEELLEELTELQLPQETIDRLLADINEQILKPLRATEENAASTPMPAPMPVSVPTRQPVPQPVTTPSPVIPAVPSPVAPVTASQPSPVSPPVPHPVAEPVMRTMARDMEAMKEHPEGIPHATVSVPFPQTASPAPMPPAPAPQPAFEHTVAPMPPQPSAPTAPAPAPIQAPESSQPVRMVAPPPNLPGAPLVKEYSLDPYREPLE